MGISPSASSFYNNNNNNNNDDDNNSSHGDMESGPSSSLLGGSSDVRTLDSFETHGQRNRLKTNGKLKNTKFSFFG